MTVVASTCRALFSGCSWWRCADVHIVRICALGWLRSSRFGMPVSSALGLMRSDRGSRRSPSHRSPYDFPTSPARRGGLSWHLNFGLARARVSLFAFVAHSPLITTTPILQRAPRTLHTRVYLYKQVRRADSIYSTNGMETRAPPLCNRPNHR